jgi:hypothetical protein
MGKALRTVISYKVWNETYQKSLEKHLHVVGAKAKNFGRGRELEEGRSSKRAHLDRMAKRIAETNCKRREETEREATETACSHQGVF